MFSSIDESPYNGFDVADIVANRLCICGRTAGVRYASMMSVGSMDLFDQIFSTYSDSTVYFLMGATGSLLFLIRLGTMLIFGGDGGDIDADANGVEAHGGGFTLFSMLSILSFMMGAGWLGLACRMEWEFGALSAAIAASVFGFSLMLLSSVGMYQMKKLNQVGRYEVRHCIGKIGRVYQRVPAKGQGRGQVQVTVDGRRLTLPAVSTGEEVASFAAVKIVEVQEGDTLVVEKP